MKEHLQSTSPGVIQALASGHKLTADLNTIAVAASGSIVFSANLVAGDTITVNGTVFTAVASGATGNQFNLGVSLTLTLDAIVTVLNASVIAGVALATYSKVSTTTLKAVYDTAGEAGNWFLFYGYSAAAPAVYANAYLTGGAAAEKIMGADGKWASVYMMSVDGAGNSAVVLPDGEEGQELTLFLKTQGSTGDVVVTPTNLAGGSTLTFDAVSELSKLQFLAGEWHVVGTNTATLA